MNAWIDWLVDEIVDAICTDSFLFSKLISSAGRSAGKPDKGVAVGLCRRNLWCACGTGPSRWKLLAIAADRMQRHWSVYMSELSGGGPCNDGDGPPLQPLAYLTSMTCCRRLGPSLLQDSVVRIRVGDWAYRAETCGHSARARADWGMGSHLLAGAT